MNYAQEALFRQQLALAALLGGGAGRRAETAERKDTRRETWAAAEAPKEAARSRAEERWERSAAEIPATERAWRGEGAKTKAEEETDTAADGRAVPLGWGGRTAGLRGQTEETWMLEGSAPSPDGPWRQGGQRGTHSAAGGETDVQAVSRAVQRDARRYDGGFTIY